MIGTGRPGIYGGIPAEHSDLSTSKVAILPIPFDKTTTYAHGSDKGPAALIEASRNMELLDIETGLETYKIGIYTAPAVVADTSESMVELGYSRTKELLNLNKFVLSLGGEHAVSYGPIKAHAEKFPGLTILQFDAHADLQPAYDGNKWSHASVMARAKELAGVSKIVSVGIRSLAIQERDNQSGVTTFYAHEICGQSGWQEKVLETLGKDVYLTFDLDAFDASIMPSTGTPEPGGLNWYEALSLIKLTAKNRNIVGADIVELLPNPAFHGPDFLAAKLAYKILSYKFNQ
jgi:agmatinase